MEDPTEQLVQRAIDGDRAAVDELLELYLPDLQAFVRLRAGPLVDARESTFDVVQSVCREALERIDSFRYPGEAAFRRWLFAITQRKIIDRRRYYLAAKRDVYREVRQHPLADDEATRLWERYQTFSTPSREVMAREEIERVERAFAQLPDADREIITLAHVAGLSRAEIAEQLGKKEGAVRIHLYRALARVSELLKEDRED